MRWDLHLAPLVPDWALGLIIAAALTLLIGGLIMRRRGLWLRAPVLLILAAFLAGPSLRQEERDPIPDIVAIVVDDSDSQAIGGRLEETEAALSALRADLERIGDLEIREARASASGPDALGETRLFTALDRLLADVPADRLAGAVLITDGQIHDVPAGGRPAGLTAPIHALVTGRRDLGDRKLSVLNAPVFAIVGKTVTLRLQVDDLGVDGPPQPAEVTVRLDGELVGTRRFVPGAPIEVNLDINHAGANVIEAVVAPGPEELTLVNNRVAVSVNGVRDRLKVLLVSGEPHAGQRTWRDLLKSDPGVDLVHFTILRPPDKQDFTRPDELALIEFPTDELFNRKLYDFDLVIFDRFKRRGVLHMAYLANVARYVEQGGALLTAAGPAFATPASLHRTPLSAVFPAQPTGAVLEQPFRPDVTDAGARHPVTAKLPGAGDGADADPDWGRWFRLIDAQALSGQTIMTGPDGRPLLVLDRFGDGRVAQLMSDHTWLWARGFEGGGPQTELLRRLAHWLMKEPELEEEDLSARSQGRRLTITRRSMDDTVPPVTLTRPSGTTRAVRLEPSEPGLWTATVETEEIGLYRLASGDLAAVVAVGPLDGKELADVRPTETLLAPVLSASGGGAHWTAPNEGDALSLPGIRRVRAGRDTAGRDWLGLVDNQNYAVRSTRDVPLLPPAVWALLLIGTLIAAWRLEAR